METKIQPWPIVIPIRSAGLLQPLLDFRLRCAIESGSGNTRYIRGHDHIREMT